jgi:hypothetical protein
MNPPQHGLVVISKSLRQQDNNFVSLALLHI